MVFFCIIVFLCVIAAIYQSKGTVLRKSMLEVPPGYDPIADTKHKTKSAKRNERTRRRNIRYNLICIHFYFRES